MRIDGYRFGWIRIDGETYRRDVLVLPDRVVCPWWRERGGHVFDSVDLKPLIAAGAEFVVLGTGRFGGVTVSPGTFTAFADGGTEVIVERTGGAVTVFNRLMEEGRSVVAGLHLTC